MDARRHSGRTIVSTPAFAARHTCDSPEWYTPLPIVEAAREVMGGIDLDPASHEEANRTVKATRFFTAEDDGLRQIWMGRVFLNPPGGLVREFWQALMLGKRMNDFEQAIWIGYSLEQLQTLQWKAGQPTPLDFPICVTARRISFVENAAKKAARREKVLFEGELPNASAAKRKSASIVRAGAELPDSPSHSNYITYIGPNSGTFTRVFSQFGKVR